jgi:hypothetical protein
LSKLLSFNATTASFAPIGAHVASLKLVGTAASTAVVLDGTGTAMVLACIANANDNWVSGDVINGAVFQGLPSISVLTAGAILTIEIL